MQEFESNCSVIDVDFDTIKHQGNTGAEGEDTEKYQINTEKKKPGKQREEMKKGILKIFSDGIISFLFSVLLMIPVLLMFIICLIASVLEIPFRLLKKANAKS